MPSYGVHRDLHSFPTRRSSDLILSKDKNFFILSHFFTHSCGNCLNVIHLSHNPISLLALHTHTLERDRKSTRLNSSHVAISYAVFCLKKKTTVSARHSTSSARM